MITVLSLFLALFSVFLTLLMPLALEKSRALSRWIILHIIETMPLEERLSAQSEWLQVCEDIDGDAERIFDAICLLYPAVRTRISIQDRLHRLRNFNDERLVVELHSSLEGVNLTIGQYNLLSYKAEKAGKRLEYVTAAAQNFISGHAQKDMSDKEACRKFLRLIKLFSRELSRYSELMNEIHPFRVCVYLVSRTDPDLKAGFDEHSASMREFARQVRDGEFFPISKAAA